MKFLVSETLTPMNFIDALISKTLASLANIGTNVVETPRFVSETK